MSNEHVHPAFLDILDAMCLPMNEGAQAFLDGRSDEENPYTAGTLLHEEWERGWDKECARFMERNAA